jgi:subtilisin family serine protease
MQNTRLERLESRTLLAANPVDPVDAFDTRRITWMGEPADAIVGQYLVQLDGMSGTPQQQTDAARRLLERDGVQVQRHLGADGSFLLRTPDELTIDAIQQALADVPQVRFVEPDFAYTLQQVFPNDSSFGTMWGLHNTGQSGGVADVDIDAPEAWRLTTGSTTNRVIVAVIDSGLDYNHPDLAGVRYVNGREIAGDGIDNDGNGFIDDTGGWDFWGNGTSSGADDNDPLDQNNHGTHVAGTIAARTNNATGVSGINWNATILPLKIGGAGSSVSGSDGVLAVNYATAIRNRGENLRVMNHSWGGGGFSQTMQNAINNATNAGIVVVAAAGNSGSSSNNFYPANYANVISVGNIDRVGGRASTSNFGSTWVDLAAPGSAILSTVRNGGYSSFSGTSMASPHVAGVAALAFALKPNASVAQVTNAILQGVDVSAAYSSLWITSGRLNAFNTLQRIALLDAPAAPDLSPAFDTGVSSTDNLTNAPTLVVTGAAPWGSTVQIRADGVLVATQTIGDLGTYSVLVPGLAEGVRDLRATFSYPSGTSPSSVSLPVTIDRTAPTLTPSPATLSPRTTPLDGLTLVTSEGVFGLDAGDVLLTRNGSPVTLGGVTLTPVTGGFAIGGLEPATTLPGVYQLSLPAAAATDAAGNATAAAVLANFRVYKPGDLNGDGLVNNGDIALFVAALTDPVGFALEQPFIDPVLSGDINGDGSFNNGDISAFVALLTGGRPALSAAPAPATASPLQIRSSGKTLFASDPLRDGDEAATAPAGTLASEPAPRELKARVRA